MGVDRTEYLFWGFKLDGDVVGDDYQAFEAEMEGGPGARFDVVYDGMSGGYAMAGKIIASADGYDGQTFTNVDEALASLDKLGLSLAVREAIPAARDMHPATFLFTHYS